MKPASVCRVLTLLPALLLFAASFSGCGQSDPLDQKVDARDPQAYRMWKGDATDSLTSADQNLYRQAENDIRLHAMAHGAGSAEEGLCREVDGKTLREVIELGLHYRIARIQGDLTESEGLLKSNSRIKGANEASQAVVDQRVAEDRARVDRDRTELAQAQSELNAFQTKK